MELVTPRRVLFFVLGLPALASAYGGYPRDPRQYSCLTNIPPEVPNYTYSQRKNIIFLGHEQNITVTGFSWMSGRISILMYKIVVEELLGYHVKVSDTDFGSAVQGYLTLFCADPTNSANPRCCEKTHNTIVTIDTWSGGLPPAKRLASQCVEMSPIWKEEMGYTAGEPIFVMEKSLVPARADYLPLDYYLTYSNPAASFSRYFSDPFSFNLSAGELRPCSETQLHSPASAIADTYKFHFPWDTAGIFNGTDGVWRMQCGGAGQDHWWLSPSCRANMSQCIPYITGGSGWRIEEIVHKAAAWELPVAVGVAGSWGLYTSLPLKYRLIMYWWWPDTTFTLETPTKIRFPAYLANEWDATPPLFSSAQPVAKLEKWADSDTANVANKGLGSPLRLLERFKFTREQMQELLDLIVASGGGTDQLEQIACGWLSNNTAVWSNWLPDERSCTEGQGLVDDQGAPIFDYDAAKTCQFCPEGRMSVKFLSTYVCEACPTGRFQGSPGETECEACPVGRASNVNGSGVCSPCEQGKYMSDTGMADCITCPQGLVTKFTASVRIDDCTCPKGKYRSTSSWDTCLDCLRGMDCPLGSDPRGYTDMSIPDVPLLLPGYWASLEDPLSIYACENQERCPGRARPGQACAGGLEKQACQHCPNNLVWDGEACTECWSPILNTIVFPIVPLFLSPALIVLLYKMFGDTYERWGTWQNGIAACVFIILNHYQIFNIIRASNIAWPEGLARSMSFVRYASDIATVFRPDCSGFGGFQAMLILRSLLPAFLAIWYFLTWAVAYLISKKIPMAYMEPNRTLNGFFSLIFTFFAGITEMAFTVFKCSPNPNNTSSLTADRSITCFESTWKELVIIGVLAVVFWVLGFGIVFIRSIYSAPSHFHNKAVQMRWKFLFIRYRTDVHWWAVIFVLKGVGLNLGSVIIRTGWGHLFYLMGCLLAYVILLSIFRPWRHMPNNVMDMWAHLSLVATICTSFWYTHDPNMDATAADDTILKLLTGFLFTVLLPVPYAVFRLLRKTISGKAKDNVEKQTELILDAFEVVMSADKEERESFLQHLTEWDFFFMFKAKEIIQTHVAKRKCRAGIAPKELDIVLVRTWHDSSGARHTKISQINRSATKSVEAVRSMTTNKSSVARPKPKPKQNETPNSQNRIEAELFDAYDDNVQGPEGKEVVFVNSVAF